MSESNNNQGVDAEKSIDMTEVKILIDSVASSIEETATKLGADTETIKRLGAGKSVALGKRGRYP
jgi:hypothetical protein